MHCDHRARADNAGGTTSAQPRVQCLRTRCAVGTASPQGRCAQACVLWEGADSRRCLCTCCPGTARSKGIHCPHPGPCPMYVANRRFPLCASPRACQHTQRPVHLQHCAPMHIALPLYTPPVPPPDLNHAALCPCPCLPACVPLAPRTLPPECGLCPEPPPPAFCTHGCTATAPLSVPASPALPAPLEGVILPGGPAPPAPAHEHTSGAGIQARAEQHPRSSKGRPDPSQPPAPFSAGQALTPHPGGAPADGQGQGRGGLGVTPGPGDPGWVCSARTLWGCAGRPPGRRPGGAGLPRALPPPRTADPRAVAPGTPTLRSGTGRHRARWAAQGAEPAPGPSSPGTEAKWAGPGTAAGWDGEEVGWGWGTRGDGVR